MKIEFYKVITFIIAYCLISIIFGRLIGNEWHDVWICVVNGVAIPIGCWFAWNK